MEGKTVIVGILILSLVLAQIQVDALLCCPTTYPPKHDCHNLSSQVCRNTPGCGIFVGSSSCPSPRNSVQVEETKLCCPNTISVRCSQFSPAGTCEKTPGCEIKIVRGNKCPYLGNSGAIITEYCKLGCASSVCNAITTLQISGDEVVNEAVEQCNNACSAFCTEGSTLEIA